MIGIMAKFLIYENRLRCGTSYLVAKI